MPRSVLERDAVTARLLETYARAAGEIAGVLAAAVQSHPAGGGVERESAWRLDRRAAAAPQRREVAVALGAGEAAFWPPLQKLDVPAMISAEMAKREAAIAAEAKEATEIASRLEEANRLARGARRRILAGSW